VQVPLPAVHEEGHWKEFMTQKRSFFSDSSSRVVSTPLPYHTLWYDCWNFVKNTDALPKHRCVQHITESSNGRAFQAVLHEGTKSATWVVKSWRVKREYHSNDTKTHTQPSQRIIAGRAKKTHLLHAQECTFQCSAVYPEIDTQQPKKVNVKVKPAETETKMISNAHNRYWDEDGDQLRNPIQQNAFTAERGD
jgi:hypothetical protein